MGKTIPIRTPEKDFDKVSYWAGMAMRGIIDQYDLECPEQRATLARLSFDVADAMIDALIDYKEGR
jgi:hypothetical protein